MLAIQWISSLVIIVLLYFVYMYLRDLNNCSCVDQEYVLRLKNIITIFISISVITMVLNALAPNLIVSYLYNREAINKYIYNRESINKYIYLFALIPLLIIIGYIYIYSYFVYDVYMFSKTMQMPCTCADAWQKWYLYFEAWTCGLLLLSIFGISGVVMLEKDFRNGFIQGFGLKVGLK